MKIIPYKDLGREPIVGDVVKIVDRPDRGAKYYRWNHDGCMNRYLSTIMTVRDVVIENISSGDWQLRMLEDIGDREACNGWYWYPEMIAGVVVDDGLIDDNACEWCVDLSELGF